MSYRDGMEKTLRERRAEFYGTDDDTRHLTIWLDSGDWETDEAFRADCERVGLKVEPNGLGLRAGVPVAVEIDEGSIWRYWVADDHRPLVEDCYRRKDSLRDALQYALDRAVEDGEVDRA